MKETILIALSVIVLFLSCETETKKGTDPDVTPVTIVSLTEKLKECAPVIESTAESRSVDQEFASWTGWDIDEEYSVLNKYFNEGSRHGIYAMGMWVDIVGDIINVLGEELGDFSRENYTAANGHLVPLVTGNFAEFSGTVTLPRIIRQTGESGVLSDFTKKVVLDITTPQDYSIDFVIYYRANESVQEFAFHQAFDFKGELTDDSQVGYVFIDMVTGELDFRFAGAGGTLPSSGTDTGGGSDVNFNASIMFFAGNHLKKSSGFTIKKSNDNGFVLLAGGAITSGASQYAVRVSNNADSTSFANNGTNTSGATNQLGYYTLLSLDDFNNRVEPDGYPKVVDDNLDDETADAASYITIGASECLGWIEKYPESESELDLVVEP